VPIYNTLLLSSCRQIATECSYYFFLIQDAAVRMTLHIVLGYDEKFMF